MFRCVAASQLASCVRCWCRERRCTQSFELHFIAGLLNFPSSQNFSIFLSAAIIFSLNIHFLESMQCSRYNAPPKNTLLPLVHPNVDSFSLNISPRSKSVCTSSLKVGLAFAVAGTIRHFSVLSISGGASQFLPPISYEAHNCRKCRLKVPQAKSPLRPFKISTQFCHLHPFYYHN